MKPFKFLRSPIAKAHDGGYIYDSHYFYTMNKEEFQLVTGEICPKYRIVRRCIHPKFRGVFQPDYEKYWYFNSLYNAEYLKTIWELEDRNS